MARLDLNDLPPRVANLLLGLDEGQELLIVQHGGLLRRMIVQTHAPAIGGTAAEPAPPTPPEPAAETGPKLMRSPIPSRDKAKEDKPAKAEPLPPPPISSPAVEQQTRDIFESFRASIEDEF